MHLRVAKADGSTEVYLHTKVIGTIAMALAECDGYEEERPEQLAEAVTTFLRRRCNNGLIDSSEIHSMIEVTLCETGYVEAALVLHEYRINRQVKRRRIEVIHTSAGKTERGDSVPGLQDCAYGKCMVEPWNKSIIARGLERERGLSHGLARAVAAMVEQKVLNLDYRRISSSLVRELVENELLGMELAQKTLCSQGSEERNVSVDRVLKEVSIFEESADFAVVAAES